MGLWIRYRLLRGPRGLGIDVDGDNTILEILPNGQAAADGLARAGDMIEAVDGRLLAGSRLVDELTLRESPSYEVTAWRSATGKMEEQSGLGIDIGDLSRVVGLVPGSMAETDELIFPGDVIVGVDGKLIGTDELPSVMQPGLASYTFLVMRFQRSGNDSFTSTTQTQATQPLFPLETPALQNAVVCRKPSSSDLTSNAIDVSHMNVGVVGERQPEVTVAAALSASSNEVEEDLSIDFSGSISDWLKKASDAAEAARQAASKLLNDGHDSDRDIFENVTGSPSLGVTFDYEIAAELGDDAVVAELKRAMAIAKTNTQESNNNNHRVKTTLADGLQRDNAETRWSVFWDAISSPPHVERKGKSISALALTRQLLDHIAATDGISINDRLLKVRVYLAPSHDDNGVRVGLVDRVRRTEVAQVNNMIGVVPQLVPVPIGNPEVGHAECASMAMMLTDAFLHTLDNGPRNTQLFIISSQPIVAHYVVAQLRDRGNVARSFSGRGY